MTKQELVVAIADKTRISQKDAAKALDAVVETIKEAVCSGDKVTLVGFGTFEARERSARTCRNPQTGDAIEVKACKVPAFKAGKAFKEELN